MKNVKYVGMFSIIVLALLTLSACNVMPVRYDDGSHWALLENPVAEKCVELSIGEGKVETNGIGSYLQGLLLDGKDIKYKSYGKMCKENMVVTDKENQ